MTNYDLAIETAINWWGDTITSKNRSAEDGHVFSKRIELFKNYLKIMVKSELLSKELCILKSNSDRTNALTIALVKSGIGISFEEEIEIGISFEEEIEMTISGECIWVSIGTDNPEIQLYANVDNKVDSKQKTIMPNKK